MKVKSDLGPDAVASASGKFVAVARILGKKVWQVVAYCPRNPETA